MAKATFEQFVAPGTRRYRRIEAGYQNVDWDPGNYTSSGIQAGTNMSISAPVLSDWRGHEVTAAEMQALTKVEALDIYRQKYWNPIHGSELDNQMIANFLADMKSSGWGVWNMQQALNDLGESVAVDGSVGAQTLAAINRQIDKSVAALNNAFRKRQIERYNSIGGPGLKNWLGSLDRDYPEMSITAEKMGLPEWLNNKWWLIASAVITVAIIIIIIAYYRKK